MAGSTPRLLELRVTLESVEPPVWRRFVISSDMYFSDLHDVLQVVMGWEDYHLHRFLAGDAIIGIPDPDFDDEETTDETDVVVGDVLAREGDSLVYEYDFGDGWSHQIVVERFAGAAGRKPLAKCLDGARSCPPEDVGGPFSYANFLDAMADPTHEDHVRFKEWIGEFDSESFSIEAVNRGLEDLFRLG